MAAIPPIEFLARHLDELHGLRTALVGLLLMSWAAAATWKPYLWPSALWVSVLVAWHLDGRLADYYRARVGTVRPLNPAARAFTLIAVGASCVLMFAAQQELQLQLAVWTVPIAALHLHVGVIGGPYRRYYVLGAVVWLMLMFLPMAPLDQASQRALGLLIGGSVTVFVGLADHRQLMRAMVRNGDTDV